MKRDSDDFRAIIGRLRSITRSFIYELADEAMKALPELLSRDHGVTVTGSLERDCLEVSPGRFIEIKMWGSGFKDGCPVEIIGEAESRLSRKHVDRFLKQISTIKGCIRKEIVPVIVAHIATPKLRSYMHERGVIYYGSFQLSRRRSNDPELP